MSCTKGSTLTSDGVKIVWDRRGRGSPMLILHGFTDYRQLMDPLAVGFAEWHDVVNIDLRGHGESGRNNDFSLARLAADIVEVSANLELESPIVLGHSLGALVATVAAADLAASAVINIDQSLNLNATAQRLSPVARQLRQPSTFHATLNALFAGENTPGLDSDIQAKLDQCAWEIDPDVVLGIWADLLDGPNPKIEAYVKEILISVTTPYLVYLGSDPGPEYQTWLLGLLPRAKIEVFAGENHFLHLANPDRLVARVRNFTA